MQQRALRWLCAGGLLVCVALVATVRLISDASSSDQRRRLNYMPSEAGEGTDYSGTLHFGERTVSTTSKGVMGFIMDKLRGMDRVAFVNMTTGRAEDAHLVHKAAASLANYSGGWDAARKVYRRGDFLHELDSAINGRVPDAGAANSTAAAEADEGPDANPYAWLKYEERPLEDLFDVVINTGNLTSKGGGDFSDWTAFLEAWRPILAKMNLIIIQQGDPAVLVPIPTWATFELYNKLDVAKVLGEQQAWIIDMDGDGPSARSFGFMASDKEFVFLLDRFSRPAVDPATGKFVNPMAGHAVTLLTPSTPYYYNTNYDPFHKATSDFSRAYPPSLRDGVPTGLSLGHVVGYAELDSATRLYKPADEETRRPGVAQTVPHGVLFSLSTANLAVSRTLAAPLMYFPSASLAAKAGYDVGDKNLEVIVGWVAKVALDWVRAGCKHGGEGYVSRLPPTPERLLADVAFDVNLAASPASSETLARFFSTVELRVGKGGVSHDSSAEAVSDLLGRLDERFGTQVPFFKKYVQAFRIFLSVYGEQHAFHPKSSVLPVASRATFAPPPDSPHRCAVFTIMHDEPYMLPVWTRYYRRHFPGSVFVIDHQRNYTSLPPEVRRAQEVNVSSLQGPGGGRDALVRYVKLFGDQKGFPVHYFVNVAQLWMSRLLRAGHACVMYTDVDEMLVAPDKTKYPRGLLDLLVEFSKDPAVQHFRGLGYNVGHVSESEDSTPPLEAPLNWSKPILEQRKYWWRNKRYDKPLLSKVPLKWKPGFHQTFPPPTILHHLGMFLLHLPEVDKAVCLAREAKKHAAMMIAHEWERGGGWNAHIFRMPEAAASGKLCRFGRAVFLKGRNAVLEHTGQDTMEKMPPEFEAVDI